MAEPLGARRPAVTPAQADSAQQGQSDQERQQSARIDVEALAERVYNLMLTDARLERARRS